MEIPSLRRAVDAAGSIAMLPAAPLVGLAEGARRDIRRRGSDALGRTMVALLDAALQSPYADEAFGRAPEIVDRVVEHLLDDELIDRLLAQIEEAGVAEQVADRLLAHGIAEHIAVRVLEGPELERMVVAALERPETELMLTRIVGSPVIEATVIQVVEEVIARLPQGDALWALVDEVAVSPAVTDAITQQGVGFADQVAEDLRDRSRTVDARLERAARRLFRRRQGPEGGGSTPSAAAAT
jgi:hypothetical protein